MKYMLLSLVILAIPIYLGLTKKQNDYQVNAIYEEYTEEYGAHQVRAEAEEKERKERAAYDREVESIADTYQVGAREVRMAIVRTFLPFGKGHARTALLVAKNESGFRLDAKGWNCHYEVGGVQKSMACRPGDRDRAWSVDCGLFQINTMGLECPAHLYTLDGNLAAAVGKFEGRGNTWWAWVAYQKLFQ